MLPELSKTQIPSSRCKIQKETKKSHRFRVVATTNIEPKTVIWFEVSSIHSGTAMMDEKSWFHLLPAWAQQQIKSLVIHKIIPFIHQTDWMLVYMIIVKLQDDKSLTLDHFFPFVNLNHDVIEMSSTDWVICRLLAKTFAMSDLDVANIHQRVKMFQFPLTPKNCPRFHVGNCIFPYTSFFQKSTMSSIHSENKVDQSNCQACIELGYETNFPTMTIIARKAIKKGEEIILSFDWFNVNPKPLSPIEKFGNIPINFFPLWQSPKLVKDIETRGCSLLILKSLVTLFNEHCFIYGSKQNSIFTESDMIKLCHLIEIGLDLPHCIRDCLLLWRTNTESAIATPHALAELCCLMEKLYSSDIVKYDLLETYILTHAIVCHDLLLQSDNSNHKTMFCYSILCTPAFIASWALKQYSTLMAKYSTKYKISSF